MPKIEKDFDFLSVLADTKLSLQRNILVSQGRIEMLEEIEKFINTNNLKVILVVEDDVLTDTNKK